MLCAPVIAIFGLCNISIYAYQIDIKCLFLISLWAHVFFTMTFKIYTHVLSRYDWNQRQEWITSLCPYYLLIQTQTSQNSSFIPQNSQMLSRIPSHHIRVMVTKRECIIQQTHNVKQMCVQAYVCMSSLEEQMNGDTCHATCL